MRHEGRAPCGLQRERRAGDRGGRVDDEHGVPDAGPGRGLRWERAGRHERREVAGAPEGVLRPKPWCSSVRSSGHSSIAGSASRICSTASPACSRSAPRRSTIKTFAAAALGDHLHPLLEHGDVVVATVGERGELHLEHAGRRRGDPLGGRPRRRGRGRVDRARHGSPSAASMPWTAARYAAGVAAASTFGIAATSAASQSTSL